MTLDQNDKAYIDQKIQEAVKFSTRIVGDTPTDANQVVPKKYADTKVQLGTVTAKGDLLVASAASVLSNFPIGTDGQVLTVSSVASLDVAWRTPVTYPSPDFGLQTGASHAFTALSPNVDNTFTLNFDPSLILFLGRATTSALTNLTTNNVFFAAGSSAGPGVWRTGTYYGPAIDSSGNIGTSGAATTTGLLRYTDSFGNIYEYVVQSHDSTSTTIRLARISGSTDTTINYQFYFFAWH